jgi:hypothetical protein
MTFQPSVCTISDAKPVYPANLCSFLCGSLTGRPTRPTDQGDDAYSEVAALDA